MTYQQGKERARERAIKWQHDFQNQAYGYKDLSEWADTFQRLGKRYGLLREFHENGIC